MKNNEKVKRNREAELLRKDNKKKKVKPLPNKRIPLGGGPFVGHHTTG